MKDVKEGRKDKDEERKGEKERGREIALQRENEEQVNGT